MNPVLCQICQKLNQPNAEMGEYIQFKSQRKVNLMRFVLVDRSPYVKYHGTAYSWKRKISMPLIIVTPQHTHTEPFQ